MEAQAPTARNTNAFFARGTLFLTTFLTTSAFSLATCVRDAQESQHVVSWLSSL